MIVRQRNPTNSVDITATLVKPSFVRERESWEKRKGKRKLGDERDVTANGLAPRERKPPGGSGGQRLSGAYLCPVV